MAEKIEQRAYKPNTITTAAPTVSDDLTKGWIVGHTAIGTGGIMYQVTDVIAGAAKWIIQNTLSVKAVTVSGGAITLDFAKALEFTNSGVISVTGATLTVNFSNDTNKKTFVITANFDIDCTVTFSQNIQHEFDTDNTKDVYKVATNQLLFKAGKYKIGGNHDGSYWGVLAKKIAI